jgi:hypothetical protein
VGVGVGVGHGVELGVGEVLPPEVGEELALALDVGLPLGDALVC